MGALLDTYTSIKEVEKTAEEVTEEVTETNEDREVLQKYAEVADDLLAEEYGKDYNEDDVVKLAQALIDYDIEQAETLEKIAELEDMGAIIGKAIKEELAK